MAISSEARNKMREINRKKAQESMKETTSSESAVDRALHDIEQEEKSETKPVTVTDTVKEVLAKKEDMSGIPSDNPLEDSNMSIHLKKGNRSVRNFAKSIRLTEKAAENMNRVAKEYNISANELINQLLEQL